jgi:hypothetical protein
MIAALDLDGPEAALTCPDDRVTGEFIVVLYAEQGMYESAVPHIDFG